MRARVPLGWRRRPAYACLLPSQTRLSCYSTHVSSRRQDAEEVRINCRSNGSITLNIHPSLNAGQPAPVILYLPTGPVGSESDEIDDDQVITALSAASHATIVRVNYRIGHGVRYPTPIHDVLTGFDWVKQNLSTNKSATARRGPSVSSISQYGVCGQLVGGSLATMLALTESRLGESRIAAAAVSNPIVDWIFPEDGEEFTSEDNSSDIMTDSLKSMRALLATPSRPKKSRRPLTSWQRYKDEKSLSNSSLLSVRRQLFRKPASYFDSFASPILFFRSPGADVPRDENGFGEDVDDETNNSTTRTQRKALKVFPPSASALVIPDMRISLGEETPLYDQGEELVKLLRRSIIRTHERRAGNEAMLDQFEDEIDATRKTVIALEEAEKRIEFHMPGRIGIWGSPFEPEWQNDVMSAGAWFRKMLG